MILKVVVGSHAHGLVTPTSDIDYRGVFVNPTEEILKIGGDKRKTNWHEGEDDSTSWEIEHFLSLSVRSNPTILETYLTPIVEDCDDWGMELGDLFSCVWSSKYVKDAFIGYGLNQRKKFLDNKDSRANKYAAAYLRTLYNGYELLTTGTFTVRIIDTEVGFWVKKWKEGDFGIGEVMEICSYWQKKLENAYTTGTEKNADIDSVNNFLLRIRKNFWREL